MFERDDRLPRGLEIQDPTSGVTYRILNKLGSGVLGDVYAVDTRPNASSPFTKRHPRALFVATAARGEAGLKCSLMKRLRDCSQVVTVLGDLFDDPVTRRACFPMERWETDVARHVQHPPARTPSLAAMAAWASQLAAALAQIHAQGVSHGVLSADSLLLRGDGQELGLCGFGPAPASAYSCGHSPLHHPGPSGGLMG
jgi:serine/threonine protein kinase